MYEGRSGQRITTLNFSMSKEKTLVTELRLEEEDEGIKKLKSVFRRNKKAEYRMNPDLAAKNLDSSSVKLNNSTSDEPDNQDQEMDPVVVWIPSKRHLITGLLGLNVFLLGMALVAGQAFNPDGLKHEEPEVFILLLIGISLSWMLWYLLWAKKQPGICPHKDHHAGGVTVTCRFLCNVLMTQDNTW